ncbi:hypothetical protein GW17_00058113 [Ensete ventricosum]|nr:hypothetical protein GW17_00058113 [Ensete ventricosum]
MSLRTIGSACGSGCTEQHVCTVAIKGSSDSHVVDSPGRALVVSKRRSCSSSNRIQQRPHVGKDRYKQLEVMQATVARG